MLRTALDSLIQKSGNEVSVYYRDLGQPDSLLLFPDLRMHAASTMKVPVMIQVYQDWKDGRLSLDDGVEVKTTFASILDGSPYELSLADDSEKTLYSQVGQEVTYRELIEYMITESSNLATNILMEEVDPQRVTASMRALGADSIQVLRGVEDGPAYRAGLSNTTTARDLGIIVSALGRGDAVSPEASGEMVEILSRQTWRDKIPAGAPDGVRVANKTGWITGINHDIGLVFPPHTPPYVLAVLTRGFHPADKAVALVARISRIVFNYHQEKYQDSHASSSS